MTAKPAWKSLKLSRRPVRPADMKELYDQLSRFNTPYVVAETSGAWGRVCRALTGDHANVLKWLSERKDVVNGEVRDMYKIFMEPSDPRPSFDRPDRHAYSFAMAIIQVLMLQCDRFEQKTS